MFARRTVGGLLLAAILAGCAGTTINQIGDPLYTGDSGECRTRLRGLDNALQIYSTDYDDQAPLANWSETLQPYFFGHPEYMACPGLHSDFSQSGFAINQDLIAVNWSSLPDPSLFVTFFETDILTPGTAGDPNVHLTTSRHAGSIFRIYADGYLENVGD